MDVVEQKILLSARDFICLTDLMFFHIATREREEHLQLWNVFGDYHNVYVLYEHKMRLITSDLLCIMQLGKIWYGS